MKIQILVVVVGIRKREEKSKNKWPNDDKQKEMKMSPRIILKGAGVIFFLCNIKKKTYNI